MKSLWLVIILVWRQRATGLNVTESDLATSSITSSVTSAVTSAITEETNQIHGKLMDTDAYLGAAILALHETNSDRFVQQLDNLIPMIPGPIKAFSGGLAGLIQTLKSNSHQRGNLTLTLDKLIELDNRVEHLINAIRKAQGNSTWLDGIEKHQSALQEIETNFAHLLSVNNASVDYSTKHCEDDKYISGWFRDQALGLHSSHRIINQALRNQDRQLYFNLTKVLVGGFIKATVLETACTSLVYVNESKDSLGSAVEDDSEDYQRMLTEMKDKFAKEDSNLVDNFWKNAQNLVAHIVNTTDHGNTDNQILADLLFNQLSKKFYWQKWFVAVYGDGQIGGLTEHRHDYKGSVVTENYASYFRFWLRYQNKNILLGSPDMSDLSAFNGRAEGCLQDASKAKFKSEDCNGAIEMLSKCMGSVRFNVVGCVKNTKKFGNARNTGEAVVYKTVVRKPLWIKFWADAVHFELYFMH